MQREQLATWFGQVRQIPNPVISAYLQALLLIGPRREELSGLRWEDVDFQWKSLTIKDRVEGLRTDSADALHCHLAGLSAAPQ